MSAAAFKNPRETIPLRYVCELNPSVSFKEYDDDSELTFLPMDRVKAGYFIPNTGKASKNCSSYSAFAEGDILLAKVTPCFENGNIAIAENLVSGKGFGSSELFVIRPSNAEARFLFYCFQSTQFKQEGEASMTGAGGLKRVSTDVLRQYRCPQIAKETQRCIADYLDGETSEIDQLIHEKERMLALLDEKRAALISHLVTRGLDTNRRLKRSGIEWLSDIPVEWTVKRGKFLFKQSDLPVRDDDDIVTCFRDGEVTLRKNRREDGFTNAVLELGYQGIRKGQLVLHSMDAFAGATGVSDSDGKCSPEYIICDPIEENLSSDYFAILLREMSKRGFIQAACSAVRERAPRIRFSHVANMFLPVPPFEEQCAIAQVLKNQRAETAELESSLKSSITLLKERRAALITAAVTGQIPLNRMKP